MCLADIARPHAAAEPEGCGIAAADYLVDIGERDRRNHRSEDLLLGDPHLVLDVGKHRRLHEVAFAERSICQRLATCHRARTLLPAGREIAGDALVLLFGNERADLGVGIDPVADLKALAKIGYALDKLVIDLALDKEAGPGAADLPGIGEHRHAGARN